MRFLKQKRIVRRLLLPAALLFGMLALALCAVPPHTAHFEAEDMPAPQSASASVPPDSGSAAENESDTPAAFVQSDDWRLLLVNAAHPLAQALTPELTQLRNDQSVDARMYPELQAMMDAARAEGLEPFICSSYRTQETQAALFEAKVQAYLDEGYSESDAEAEAAKWVARPGESEHETGLAVDIVSVSQQILDDRQDLTAEQAWLHAHAHEYGFILRYPDGCTKHTGITYEPWHYRYVGRDAAAEIYAQGVCLEEYLSDPGYE